MRLSSWASRHHHALIPLIVLVAVALGVAVFWGALVAWFSGEQVSSDSGGSAAVSASDDSRAAPAEHSFSVPARKRLQEAFKAYEQVRAVLAVDTLERLAERTDAIHRSLSAVDEALSEAPPAAHEALEGAIRAARELARSQALPEARLRFGELSEALIHLVEMDPELAEGWHVFRCSMAEGFQKWFQRRPRLENPYMGQEMLACGEETGWTTAAPTAHPHDDGEIGYWTCSMHPSVKQEEPGLCPICNMDLTPVTKEALETGQILIDAVRRQRLGIRTAPAERRSLKRCIRAVGEVTYDEAAVHDVTLRVEGWVEDLRVDETGQRVDRGQTLFTIYSPELFSAQQELIIARSGGGGLARAARKRLRLWGLAESEIDEVLRRRESQEVVPIESPASGVVIEKNVVEGSHIRSGERLYRIASLARVWVEADVYEQDLPLMEVGQPVTVTLPYLPGRSFEGMVAYVYPYLDGRTRTGKIRIELENPDGLLRPEMYANVTLEVDAGDHLAVPAEAIIYTGPRRLVFVDLGEGRLRPQEIEVGTRAGKWVEVLSGLSEGDVVVTSGNFLVAAESRIRSATDYWSATVDAD